LLSVGLEKETGQGRTYSQDVGRSPIKELNWACGKKHETWFSGKGKLAQYSKYVVLLSWR